MWIELQTGEPFMNQGFAWLQAQINASIKEIRKNHMPWLIIVNCFFVFFRCQLLGVFNESIEALETGSTGEKKLPEEFTAWLKGFMFLLQMTKKSVENRFTRS